MPPLLLPRRCNDRLHVLVLILNLALPEHGVTQVDLVHPLQVVVHHPLQDIIGVTLMRLQDLVHHRPTLQKIRCTLHHKGIVEVDLDKRVLTRMISVHGDTTHHDRLVHVLDGSIALLHGDVDGLVQAGRQPVHEPVLLPRRERDVDVGEYSVNVETDSLTGGGGAEHADDGDLLDVVAGEVRHQRVDSSDGRSLIVVSYDQAD